MGKKVQKPTTTHEIKNSYLQFSKAIYEAAIDSTTGKSPKWVNIKFFYAQTIENWIHT